MFAAIKMNHYKSECKLTLCLNNCKTHVRTDEGKPVESSDPDSLFSLFFANSRRPVNGAAANQIMRCTVWCPTVPSQSASTPCMNRSSAAPSVKTVNANLLWKCKNNSFKAITFP